MQRIVERMHTETLTHAHPQRDDNVRILNSHTFQCTQLDRRGNAHVAQGRARAPLYAKVCANVRVLCWLCCACASANILIAYTRVHQVFDGDRSKGTHHLIVRLHRNMLASVITSHHYWRSHAQCRAICHRAGCACVRSARHVSSAIVDVTRRMRAHCTANSIYNT